jgi:hypothetical protein
MALFTYSDLKNVAFSVSDSAALNESFENRAENISVNSYDNFDIFLSHSYQDKEIIPKLKKVLEGLGYSVYVDWITDHLLSRNHVDKETANILQKRMKQCKCLIYDTSENSSNSNWMPWELGYFDGIKYKRVAILPLKKNDNNFNDNFRGEEYLGLYYYIDKATMKNQVQDSLFVNESSNVYTTFDGWLKGKSPIKR